MPLVVVCGNPSTGKTKRSKELAQYLRQKHNCQEQIKIKDISVSHQLYRRQLIENNKRKNQILGKTIVIADSLNYIKGYRYQMYCIARQQKTTYCVLYCNSSEQSVRQFSKNNQTGFSQELIKQLSARMEPPSLKNRWDVPLFQRRQEESTPLEEIANVLLFEVKKSKDPVSTRQQQKLGQNYIYQAEALAQQLCQQASMGKLKLKNSWNLLQLKKVKNQFIGMLREKPLPNKSIKEAFLQFLTEADKRK